MKIKNILNENNTDDQEIETDPVYVFYHLANLYKPSAPTDAKTLRLVRTYENILINATHDQSVHNELFAYAVHIKKQRWKAIEPLLIMFSPSHAIEYATTILKRRWPAFEKYLIEHDGIRSNKPDRNYLLRYVQALQDSKIVTEDEAKELRKEMLSQQAMPPLKENTIPVHKLEISHDDIFCPPIPESAVTLALDILAVNNKRYIKLENIILQDPLSAYRYAAIGFKQRWKTAEPIIAQNSSSALAYARYVLKSRFKIGEQAISTDAHHSYIYAKEVLKGRFPAGEPTIEKDIFVKQKYANFLESIDQVMESTAKQRTRYNQAALNGTVFGHKEEYANVCMEDSNAALTYALSVLKKRWKAAEPIMFSEVTEDNRIKMYKYCILYKVKPPRNTERQMLLSLGFSEQVKYAMTIDSKWSRDMIDNRLVNSKYGFLANNWHIVIPYIVNVKKRNFPEFEKRILNEVAGNFMGIGYLISYFDEVMTSERWTELEQILTVLPPSEDRTDFINEYTDIRTKREKHD